MENNDDLKWLETFSGPGDYKRYAESKGNRVSLQFCLASSKIMERFGITFSETCRLLMKEGYLIWMGETPLYNMAGDKLWRTKEYLKRINSLPKVKYCPPKIESEFNSAPEISCVFNTVVIRNESINQRFKGGIKSFVSEHRVSYNNELSVMCFMGPADLDDTLEMLENKGLKWEEDFTWFDATAISRKKPKVKAIPFRVKWLKGYCKDGRAYVSLVSQ
jgi:hypothetical protein